MKVSPKQMGLRKEYPVGKGLTKEVRDALSAPDTGLTVEGFGCDRYVTEPLSGRKPVTVLGMQERIHRILSVMEVPNRDLARTLSPLPNQIPLGLYEDSYDLQVAADVFLACSAMLSPGRRALLVLDGTTLQFWDYG